MGLYFEEYEIGKTYVFDPVTVDKEEVIAFGNKFDPRPIHVDEKQAKESPFKGIIASGFHTLLLGWYQWVASRTDEGPLVAGMTIEKTEWREPVYPGDVLRNEFIILDKKLFSNGKAGQVFIRMNLYNQKDELVLLFDCSAMVNCKNKK